MIFARSSSPTSFETLLPRLVNAYHKGILAPFLGAGMSVSGDTGCPNWATLVGALEDTARIPRSSGDDPAQLIQRANHVARALTREGVGALATAVRKALYTPQTTPSAATRKLAAIWWPLIISTNYDDLFALAYCPDLGAGQLGPRDSFATPSRGFALEVRGRSVEDCESILISLRETRRSILWALHGFLPEGARHGYARRSATRLASELVLGHEAYQRVAHASTHYRRAFAEAYRQRSFLFLGTSLSDVYLLGLFAEVQELYGPSPLPHYAMVREGEVDRDFLRSRFNILCIEYTDHRDLPDLLSQMTDAVIQRKAAPTRWAFSSRRKDPDSQLQVHAGRLPLRQDRSAAIPTGDQESSTRGSECFVFGVASDGTQLGPMTLPWYPHFGRELKNALRSAGLAEVLDAEKHGRWRVASQALRIPELGDYVFELPEQGSSSVSPYAVVSAWRRNVEGQVAKRDTRMISEATVSALRWAATRGFRRVHMPLLATGRGTHIIARYSLVEMVRGFARWAQRASAALTLTVHVLNCSATFELTSGRLDVSELLMSPDTIRFWIELRGAEGEGSRQGGLERELLVLSTQTSLAAVAAAASLDLNTWRATLNPSPIGNRQTFTAEMGDLSLDAMGVVPGATLRFTRLHDG